jgi:hypothetical protein
VGDAPGFTNLSNRSDHGWTRSVHSNGHDLEPTRQGNSDYCAILVVVNSVLQIILYSPYALLFINVVGGQSQEGLHVSYGNVAISVLIVRQPAPYLFFIL